MKGANCPYCDCEKILISELNWHSIIICYFTTMKEGFDLTGLSELLNSQSGTLTDVTIINYTIKKWIYS